MKVVIKSIDLNPIKCTALGDKGEEFINGKCRVSYMLIKGFNVLDGSIELPEHLDSIVEIEKRILTECKEAFGKLEMKAGI